MTWNQSEDGRYRLKNEDGECLAVIRFVPGVLRIKDSYQFVISGAAGTKFKVGALESADIAQAQSEVSAMLVR